MHSGNREIFKGSIVNDRLLKRKINEKLKALFPLPTLTKGDFKSMNSATEAKELPVPLLEKVPANVRQCDIVFPILHFMDRSHLIAEWSRQLETAGSFATKFIDYDETLHDCTVVEYKGGKFLCHTERGQEWKDESDLLFPNEQLIGKRADFTYAHARALAADFERNVITTQICKILDPLLRNHWPIFEEFWEQRYTKSHCVDEGLLHLRIKSSKSWRNCIMNRS